MTSRLLKSTLSACASILVAGATAYAVPTLYAPATFESGTEGWYSSGDVSISQGLLGGENALILNFGAQGVPQPEEGLAYAGSGSSFDRFVGDYSGIGNDLLVQFRFYAESYQPSGLALYFHSDTSGRTWVYNLGLPTVGVWAGYSVGMGSMGGWAREDLTPPDSADFLADLADVDWIGLYVIRNPNTSSQNYGLDDFQLAVPEPQTICLLLAAMMSLGFTFRSKVGSAMAGMKSLLHIA